VFRDKTIGDPRTPSTADEFDGLRRAGRAGPGVSKVRYGFQDVIPIGFQPTISGIKLLSDTELAKHRVEHVFGADLAGERA
jgi:hypothetical protein